MRAYFVGFFSTHPDLNNDDCNEGEDFDTKEEALAHFNTDGDYYCAFIQIDGPDINQIRKNPTHSSKRVAREEEAARNEERSERAMQAGMAFGCQGYNEGMGYE